MSEVEKNIREITKKLLKEEKVKLVIGYEAGSLPLRTTPCLVHDVDDSDRLIWNVTCDNNLAKFLIGKQEKTGIVTKACDNRTIVTCITEKQINRNNIFIIGVPCSGVIDRKKVATKLNGKEIIEAKIDGDRIALKGDDFKVNLLVKDVLDDSCLSCEHKNPVLYDVLVAPEIRDSVEKKMKSSCISEVETKSDGERWEYFRKELSKCIRCYACRNVCPLCYCKECFVDQNGPIWVGKTNDVSDTMVYHINRIFHVAGRCVDCGACSRACPMGIDLRILTQKMAKLVKDLYGFEGGLNPKDAPLLSTFKQDDPQEFIM